MANSSGEQGREKDSEGWGTIGNKQLFKWIVEQEKAWEEREGLIREMDPKMKNTIVEQNVLKKRMAVDNDYYEFILSKREAQSNSEDTRWQEDHERDEGGKFTWIASQDK
jgi:hypothetical protein